LKNRRTLLKAIPFDLSLRDALGDKLRVLPDECAPYHVCGAVPKSVALPRGPADAALALKAASAEGAVVVLRGAGTKMHRPPPPRSVDVVIETLACKGIVDHAAADLTVTVNGGTTLGALDRALEKANQFWPCDAPFAESATIGGTIAAGAAGALRQRFGSIRDLLLGARIITADGAAVRCGARVVKSVAGYDLHKLLVGSWGTLGLISEVTLKVAPMPETERGVIARFANGAHASAAALAIAGSNLFVMATAVHDEESVRRVGALLAHASRDCWMLTARCGGNRRNVERQIDGITSLCRAAGAQSVSDLDSSAVRRAWVDIRELAGGALYAADRFAVLKIVALPHDTAKVLETAKDAWPNAEVTAHPFGGIVFVHVPLEGLSYGVEAFESAFDRCERAGWYARLLSVPDQVAASFPQPSVPPAPVKLLRAVKTAFDPGGVLDPGRLPAGV